MRERDLARIRHVTRHFHSLQGLVWATNLPYLVVLWLPASTHPIESYLKGVAVVCLLLLVSGLSHLVRRHYAQRFGAVRDENLMERAWPWAIVFGMAMAGDLIRARAGAGGPSAVLLAAAALGVWRAARGWPWRAHQLILAIVAAGALVVLPLPGPLGDPVAHIRLVSLLVFGAIAICALLDHRLLVTTLKPVRRDASDTVPEELA